MDIKPFKIKIPDAVLADLQERLARTRWPDEIADSEWDYGTNLGYIKGSWTTGRRDSTGGPRKMP